MSRNNVCGPDACSPNKNSTIKEINKYTHKKCDSLWLHQITLSPDYCVLYESSIAIDYKIGSPRNHQSLLPGTYITYRNSCYHIYGCLRLTPKIFFKIPNWQHQSLIMVYGFPQLINPHIIYTTNLKYSRPRDLSIVFQDKSIKNLVIDSITVF